MREESRKPERQGDVEKIVEDASLPFMEDDGAGVRDLMPSQERLRDGGDRAATLPPPLEVKPAAEPEATMAAFRPEDVTEESEERAAEEARARGEQQEREQPTREEKEESPGYLRLRVRLEDDRLEVVGVRSVEGPLAQEDTLQGDLVYEVRAGDRRIGIGTVPDATEMRSFPPPEPREDMVGHHVTPLRAVEFNVRVPRQEISMEALERVSIDVFELKEVPERRALSAEPLAQQIGKEARLITRLQSLQPDRLAPRVRDELKRAVRY